MKIKLIQTGGLLPIKKEASAEVTWSDDELDHLISEIKTKDTINSPIRDAIYHILEVNGKEISIDLNKIPKQHKPIFNNLKKKLTIIKF
jgi:hypothetical protein